MKVLIVEDDKIFRMILGAKMKEEGFSPEFAVDGKSAVEMFIKSPPDAVLLDLGLPDVNGVQVLAAMRKRNEHIPVIVVTGDGKISTAVRLVKAGAYDYIVKSAIEDIASVVRTAVTIGQSPGLVHDHVQSVEQDKNIPVHREYRRIAYREKVFVDGKYWGKGINLSERGAYIHTGRSHKVGSPIHLRLPVGGREESFGGAVRQSEYGVGVGIEFIDIPAEAKERLRRFIERSVKGDRPAEDRKQWVLMICEDSSALRMYKSQMIVSGLSILEADSLKKAVDHLRKKSIKAVVLDVDMPGVDAPRVIRAIKAAPSLSSVPVVAFYTTYQREFEDDIMKTGVAFHASRVTTTPKKLARFLNQD